MIPLDIPSPASPSRARPTPDAWRGHIHSFDVARMLAALAVVLFHWQEFTVGGSPPPFMPWLQPFYLFGAFAVPFFFTLSGFVFTWLYADTVHQGSVGPKSFAIGRISRLYPLFFVTFLIAAIALPVCRSVSGFPFSYLYTDRYHAALSVFMLNGWGFEQGFSFNGPSWSVSTELFLYITFFVVARLTRLEWRTSLIVIGIGFLMTPVSVHVAGGLAQFFAGSIVYRAVMSWGEKRRFRWIASAMVVGVACVIVYAWEYRSGTVLMLAKSAAPHLRKIDVRYQIARDLLFATVLFPMLVFMLAAMESSSRVRSLLNRSIIRWMGDISYAIYLCHFPLMMIAAVLVGLGGFSGRVFYSPLAIVGFLATLLLCAHVAFYGFERPVMRAIRMTNKA